LKIELGATYPHPMVDHSEAREKALEGFQAIKRAGVSREA
jgi:deoxyribodipyrimidine photolyase